MNFWLTFSGPKFHLRCSASALRTVTRNQTRKMQSISIQARNMQSISTVLQLGTCKAFSVRPVTCKAYPSRLGTWEVFQSWIWTSTTQFPPRSGTYKAFSPQPVTYQAFPSKHGNAYPPLVRNMQNMCINLQIFLRFSRIKVYDHSFQRMQK